MPGIITSSSTTSGFAPASSSASARRAVLGGVHLEAAQLEQAREIGADALGVVDDEDAATALGHGGLGTAPELSQVRARQRHYADSSTGDAAGRRKTKREPPPRRSSAWIAPPCASTMRLQMARPRPSPPARGASTCT